jgi:hypothetical protein
MAAVKATFPISPTHILQDQDQVDAIAKRMKWAQAGLPLVTN